MVRRILATNDGAVEEAARLLREGQLVAVPTETVYGLAADATNGSGVAAIYAAKGRPSFNPLIIHVDTIAMAEQHAQMDAVACRLAEHFWPGPLTMILPARVGSSVHPLVRAGLATLAVRMPKGIAREVIARLGRPVAAPSANRSGGVSPTTAAHVMRSLGDKVDLVLDAGPAPVGVESTIVRPEADRVVVLRPGGVTITDLEAACGLPVQAASSDAPIEAPGQMLSHYAPHGRVRLDARAVEPGEWLVRFGRASVEGEAQAAGVRQLSAGGDIAEAAANLFSVLSELDRPDIGRIAVMPVPDEGIGVAINDRLRRAAAPRTDGGSNHG